MTGQTATSDARNAAYHAAIGAADAVLVAAYAAHRTAYVAADDAYEASLKVDYDAARKVARESEMA